MISKEQYEKAIQDKENSERIISAYKQQESDAWEKKQKERQDNCPDHEYVYTNSKWRSTNERQCINCGKIID